MQGMKISEATRHCALSRTTLWRMCTDKKIPAHQEGTSWIIEANSPEEFRKLLKEAGEDENARAA